MRGISVISDRECIARLPVSSDNVGAVRLICAPSSITLSAIVVKKVQSYVAQYKLLWFTQPCEFVFAVEDGLTEAHTTAEHADKVSFEEASPRRLRVFRAGDRHPSVDVDLEIENNGTTEFSVHVSDTNSHWLMTTVRYEQGRTDPRRDEMTQELRTREKIRVLIE
jgi:hypothetical protein